jgi:hypothetical protein
MLRVGGRPAIRQQSFQGGGVAWSDGLNPTQHIGQARRERAKYKVQSASLTPLREIQLHALWSNRFSLHQDRPFSAQAADSD